MRFSFAPFAVTALLAAMPVGAARYECLIEPWKVVRVGAHSTGVLTDLKIDRGDRVNKGQEIAQLNSEIEAASFKLAQERAALTISVELAQARRAYEELNLARARSLNERELLSQQELDTVLATHEISRLQVIEAEDARRIAALELERNRAFFDRRTIRSPLDGIVMSTDRALGEFLSENDDVATIAQIDPLKVEAFLPLALLSVAKLGGVVKIYPQEPVGGVYDGVIDVVDSVVDARSGTIGIRVRLENPDLTTLAGLRCDLEFFEN